MKNSKVKNAWIEKAAKYFVDNFNGKTILESFETELSDFDFYIMKINVTVDEMIDIFKDGRAFKYVKDDDIVKTFHINCWGHMVPINNDNPKALCFWKFYNPFVDEDYYSEKNVLINGSNFEIATKDEETTGVIVGLTEGQVENFNNMVDSCWKARCDAEHFSKCMEKSLKEINLIND